MQLGIAAARCSLATAMIGLSLCATHAEAQGIDHARRLYLEADFEGAASGFEEVLARPSLDVATAAEAHRYLAVLRALLGDEDGARHHAALAVALDPAVAAPEGAPGWVNEAMDGARAQFAGRAARLAIGSEADREAFRVRATLEPAPEGLVEELSLRCVSGTAQERADGAPPEVTLTIAPAGEVVHCRASAATAGGAALFTAREALSVQADAGAPAAALTLSSEDDEDGGGSAWPWIAVGGGLLVAGAVVAVWLLASRPDTAQVDAPRAEW